METETLEKIIQNLEKMQKIEDLEKIATTIHNYAEELVMILYKNSMAFSFKYDSAIKCVQIYGSVTGQQYDVLCGNNIENLTLKDLVDKALNNKEYTEKALKEIAEYLKELADTILDAISEHKQDP